MSVKKNFKLKPFFYEPRGLRIDFSGFVGNRLKINIKEWLLKAVDDNPAIIDMFKYKEKEFFLNLDIWSGEYLGKFLISLVLCWKVNKNDKLEKLIQKLINEISNIQEKDGYLGPFDKDLRFFGKIKKFIKSDWLDLHNYNGCSDIHKLLCTLRNTPLYDENVCDLWGHYHIMQGLWYWYCETGDDLAYKTCIKAADLICETFLDFKINISDAGSLEFNMAIIHIFCLLYKEIGNSKYLKIINKIKSEWVKKDAGNYLIAATKGKDFFETPKPRWESLHSIQALAELYYITGNVKYKKAFEHFYWSIAKYDRHNTGGFSSGEQARGNPYDPRVIETCATIAWLTLSVDMINLTGSSLVADELELSTLNAMLGSQAQSGRWWTYNTPMDGFKKPFYQDANWQCIPGGPELNCCYTNAARGLGILSKWALMRFDNGYVINYYGPCIFEFLFSNKNKIRIKQETSYPKNGQINLKFALEKSEKFVLKLRIPKWSKNTFIKINGKSILNITPGTYLSINRIWKNNDMIILNLDMNFHYWIGENECNGKTSIYYGPILLAMEDYLNSSIFKKIKFINYESIKKGFKKINLNNKWLLLKFCLENDNNLFLCDFASAGSNGSYYKTWLPLIKSQSDNLNSFFNLYSNRKNYDQ